LSQSHTAQERLAQEVDAVLAGRTPTVVDLPSLPFAENVILEAMRLYPAAYTIGREAIADFEIGSYHVAAGTTLLMSPWVMHRDPRFFTAPEEFRPERWQGDLARRLPRVVYFPFGAGPRICIGNAFAMMETALALVTIAQKFCFTLAEGATVTAWPTFTLRPKPGVPAVLIRRKT
jgi:cytochrome P450